MRTLEDMIRMEVIQNCSALVHTIAQGQLTGAVQDLNLLVDAAMELHSPLLDYESAARDDGWTMRGDSIVHVETAASWADVTDDGDPYDSEYDARNDGWTDAPDGTVERITQEADTWEGACDLTRTDPHEREIFEHWIVTDWFARKLEDAGERVEHDFAGLCVWGRTTTGQGIAMDSVIADIYAATHTA